MSLPGDDRDDQTLEHWETAYICTSSKLDSTCQKIGLLSLILVIVVIAFSAPSYNEGFASENQISHTSFRSQESTENKPNFLVIVADDMALNSIGYQPYDLPISTPFLTKLSSRGIRNLNYYGQEICTPSRAAFLTGLYCGMN